MRPNGGIAWFAQGIQREKTFYAVRNLLGGGKEYAMDMRMMGAIIPVIAIILNAPPTIVDWGVDLNHSVVWCVVEDNNTIDDLEGVRLIEDGADLPMRMSEITRGRALFEADIDPARPHDYTFRALDEMETAEQEYAYAVGEDSPLPGTADSEDEPSDPDEADEPDTPDDGGSGGGGGGGGSGGSGGSGEPEQPGTGDAELIGWRGVSLTERQRQITAVAIIGGFFVVVYVVVIGVGMPLGGRFGPRRRTPRPRRRPKKKPRKKSPKKSRKSKGYSQSGRGKRAKPKKRTRARRS